MNDDTKPVPSPMSYDCGCSEEKSRSVVSKGNTKGMGSDDWRNRLSIEPNWKKDP
ncbi:hypothetical protein CC2G_009561 [Coprinopsis cinerea AmutBmut pab1-1]|nr:hypothetical protein CC2G_009561 [Coprinopsis cinerea AmutBmut pab1-1]